MYFKYNYYYYFCRKFIKTFLSAIEASSLTDVLEDNVASVQTSFLIYSIKRTYMKIKITLALAVLSIFVACTGGKNQEKNSVKAEENSEAMRLLQGIWLDQDEDIPSFWAKGDSLFYPDTTSMPARFSVIGDTLIIEGEGEDDVKYPIVKQSEHIFEFQNKSGETIHLVKGDSVNDSHFFVVAKPVILNQLKTIKRDTVIFAANERYHLYVQVNPTRQKVYKQTINDDGVVVENVYYDNSIRFIIFHGNQRCYQHDFHRDDFKKIVPVEFFRNSVLSDLVYKSHNADGVHYIAHLAVPDSPSLYEIDVFVDYKGKSVQMSLVDGE